MEKGRPKGRGRAWQRHAGQIAIGERCGGGVAGAAWHRRPGVDTGGANLLDTGEDNGTCSEKWGGAQGEVGRSGGV